MQSPIRFRILEDAKDRILEERDNALLRQSLYREESPKWHYWQGAHDWLTEAAKMIDKSMEDN